MFHLIPSFYSNQIQDSTQQSDCWYLCLAIVHMFISCCPYVLQLRLFYELKVIRSHEVTHQCIFARVNCDLRLSNIVVLNFLSYFKYFSGTSPPQLVVKLGKVKPPTLWMESQPLSMKAENVLKQSQRNLLGGQQIY